MIGMVSSTASAMLVQTAHPPATAVDQAAVDMSRPPPSVIVTLGSSQAEPDSTYAPSRPAALTWANRSTDAVTAMMAGNYGAASLSGRLAGLGKALLDRFATDGSDFSQSVSATALAASGAHADTTFTIKTASGVTVVLSLKSGDDGLAVTSRSNASLSDTERAAVARLSGAFQKALDGMVASPPKLDLGGLMDFDPKVLASVDMKFDMATDRSTPQTVAFHADSASRSIKTSGDLGTIDMSVDMRSAAILGNPSQRAATIDNYLKQFDKASSRGRADPVLMTMFKDAFTQLNTIQDDGASALLKTPPRIPLSANDHAMLTGLADFRASVIQASSTPNPMRADEKDGFSYQVSQETQLGGRDASSRTISQRQRSQLTASFHGALSPDLSLMLTNDPKSQNYYYTQVDDSADSQTDIAYRKGRLAQASVTQSASQSTHQAKYIMGKLVEETTTPYARSGTRNLLGLLKPFEDEGRALTRQRRSEWEQTLSSIHAGMGLQSDPSRIDVPRT